MIIKLEINDQLNNGLRDRGEGLEKRLRDHRTPNTVIYRSCHEPYAVHDLYVTNLDNHVII